jgi:hypothetical protein
VVSPEGAGPKPDRPNTGRRVLLAVAALVVAAGFAVLGALSPAEEIAVETTTTTTTPTTTTTVIEAPIDLENFDIGQIVSGAPLDLTRSTEIEGGYPLGLVELDSGLYVFMTTSTEWLADEGGLWAWHSSDGSDWNPLGEVIDDRFQVTRVIGADESMLAIGLSIDDGTVMLWESEDGVDWEATEVGTGKVSAYGRSIPTAIGSSGDMTVVATVDGNDMQGLIEDALRDSGFEVELGRWGWDLNAEVEGISSVTVYGPLGIAVAEVPLDDLALSDEDRTILEGGYEPSPQGSVIWVQDPESGWVESLIPDMFGVETIAPLPDGGVVARGWGNAGMVTAITEDGQVWTSLDSGDNGPWSAVQWGESMVGPDDRSVPELLISADGETWEEAGLASRFPVAINWSTYPMAAGPGGVALAVSGSSAGPQMGTQEPTTFLTDKGHTISLDPMSGRLEVEAGYMSHAWHVYGNTNPEDLLVDLAAETIEFLDPEAGISFGKVTFEELNRAEEDFYRSEYRGDEHRALVFTPDGEQWTIQNLAESIGPEAAVTNLMVGANRLVAVVLPEGDWYYPMVDPGFEIWMAPLP